MKVVKNREQIKFVHYTQNDKERWGLTLTFPSGIF